MTPRERAELVFSEHEFAWREGERGHHIALVEKAISGAIKEAVREAVLQERRAIANYITGRPEPFKATTCPDCGVADGSEHKAICPRMPSY
jgi:hypothetical protein